MTTSPAGAAKTTVLPSGCRSGRIPPGISQTSGASDCGDGGAGAPASAPPAQGTTPAARASMRALRSFMLATGQAGAALFRRLFLRRLRPAEAIAHRQRHDVDVVVVRVDAQRKDRGCRR